MERIRSRRVAPVAALGLLSCWASARPRRIAALFATSFCFTTHGAAEPFTPTPAETIMKVTSLPSPRRDGPLSLEKTLQQRRSVRAFTDQPLTQTEIAQLLWAAQGVTGAEGERTAPSAGALYPLEVYAITSSGVFHYDPGRHALARVRDGDRRAELSAAAWDEESVRQAPLTVVITAVFARTETKYGRTRSPRYVHLEAGHAAQNLLLQAVVLGLGAVPVGAFGDKQVQAVLGDPGDRQPLYLIPVGHPR